MKITQYIYKLYNQTTLFLQTVFKYSLKVFFQYLYGIINDWYALCLSQKTTLVI